MKIAVVGSYGAGLTMRTPRVPGAGETLLGGQFSEGPGGKGSNQAIAAARLGADCSFLTAVGDDSFGRSAKLLWEKEGVNAEKTRTSSDAATMVGVIMVEPDGENRIVIASGALDTLTAEDVHLFEEEISEADVLIVSMEIPLPIVIEALRLGHELGTRTLLNPAPAHPLPDYAWSFVDVVTPNQSESQILLGRDSGTDLELARELQAVSGATVVMTRGGQGSLIVDSDLELVVPAADMGPVVDTTGAGDTFTAALAVGLAEGNSIQQAAEFASRAGGFAVTAEGVVPALPTRDQIEVR